MLFEILSDDFLGRPVWMWLGFFAAILVLLALDLGLLNRKPGEIGVVQSLGLSAFYIAAGLVFCAWVWSTLGPAAGESFLTGFLIEKSLSVDNVFIISLIFAHFAIPRHLQHRVLFWGIFGVIVLRAIMIAAGAALVSSFAWTLYIFGAFLILTGIKMLFSGEGTKEIGDSAILRILRKRMRVTDQLDGERFWVKAVPPGKKRPVWHATPLFLALVLIEFADLIFAVDSVPAVFSITLDPFVVYTSNIFAILGLRALYFALAASIARFAYLKYALAAILILVGAKIFAAHLIGPIPAVWSLGATVALLAAGIAFSMWKTAATATASAENDRDS